MVNNNIYNDISKRTDGDIYIGIVGPVRTGKSTFIKKFMETLVIPNIELRILQNTLLRLVQTSSMTMNTLSISQMKK